MILSAENILLLGSILLIISILASKTSYRFGIPALILFLVIGMLAGSDGPGGIYFYDPKISQFLGVVALTFILFSGGLDTKWESIKPVLRNGIALSTLGVFLTAVLVGWFSMYVLKCTMLEGLLLGSIVSSTDAAAVFSILRSKNIGLKGTLRPLLEFESGSNDPMAYFLTISFIQLITSQQGSMIGLLPQFVKAMGLGGLCGYAFGRIMTEIVNRIKLDVEGLYPVLVMAMIFFTFSFTDFIEGNGFLAVYIAAIILGNSRFIHKRSLMKFYDGMAWLMQIVMFLTLGLLVYPTQIIPVIVPGLLISVFLILVARPVAVFISLIFARDLNMRKKAYVSWVGLRGAIPIVLATYPLLANIPIANTIFNLVFFISASSVLLQGTTLTVMAKWLNLDVPEKIKRKYPLDLELKEEEDQSELLELDVPEGSPAVGKQIYQLRFPPLALIVLIRRGGRYLTVNGQTEISAGDHLLVMAKSKEHIKEVYNLFMDESN